MSRSDAAARRAARAQARGKRTRGRFGLQEQSSSLGRNYVQDPATGLMRGAQRSGETTADGRRTRQALRRCSWCRGTGARPIATGTGRDKVVHGVVQCDHRWSVRDAGPGAKPLEADDILHCRACDQAGEIVLRQDGQVVWRGQCSVCCGWAAVWNLPWPGRRKAIGRRQG